MSIRRDDIQAALEMEGKKRDFPPSHPGDILRDDFLAPLGLTQTKLADDLGIPIGRINQIVTGKRAVTAETAVLLARYFGTDPQFWMNLQTGYEIACAVETMGPAIRRVKPLQKKQTA